MLPHEAAVPRDVRRENAREPTLDPFSAESALLEQSAATQSGKSGYSRKSLRRWESLINRTSSGACISTSIASLSASRAERLMAAHRPTETQLLVVKI